MTSNTFVRGFAGLAFWVVVAISAKAQDITYFVANYPNAQVDSVVGGQDTVTGEITTDGYVGTTSLLFNSPILSGSFSVTNAAGLTYSVTQAQFNDSSGLIQFSPTTISTSPGDYFDMYGAVTGVPHLVLNLAYGDDTTTGVQYFDLYEAGLSYNRISTFPPLPPLPPYFSSGSPGYSYGVQDMFGNETSPGGLILGGSPAPFTIATAAASFPISVGWANPVNGTWSVASNWTPANVPTSTISANFNTGSTAPYTVTLSGSAAANNVTVEGDSVTLNLGSNQLALAGALSISGSGGQPGSLTIAGTTGSSAVVAGGVGVGLPTDSVPTSIARYNRLSILQGATLTGNVTTNPSGQLLGNGTIVGNIVNGGVVSPGSSTTPGQLLIGGNYSQSASGALNIRVNGTSASGNFDSLAVTVGASLNGKLGVTTFGSSASPGYLPYNDTFNIVTAGGSMSGTFSNAPAVVQTSFAGDGNTSGVFDVSYGSSGVALTDFHQVHVLSYGVNFTDGSLSGGSAASMVSGAFTNVAGVVDNTAISLSSSQSNNGQALLTNISAMAANVHSGDTCIFFITSHGQHSSLQNGEEAPISTQKDVNMMITAGTTSSPTDLYLSDGGSFLSGATLAKAFSSANWVGVNKLFVVDSCYAGGLWFGPSATGGSIAYLSGLDHQRNYCCCPGRQPGLVQHCKQHRLLVRGAYADIGQSRHSQIDIKCARSRHKSAY